MTYDYDKLYGENKDALGPPSAEFVAFFDSYGTENARVLDIGCGQGRDALFIGRRGHRVVGVDLSANGIKDLRSAAKAEALAVEGIVADLKSFHPDGDFDVVLVDRTLHMLPKADHLAALARLLDHVRVGGWLLIADEQSNMQGFKDVISAHEGAWTVTMAKTGYLFLQRAGG